MNRHRYKLSLNRIQRLFPLVILSVSMVAACSLSSFFKEPKTHKISDLANCLWDFPGVRLEETKEFFWGA